MSSASVRFMLVNANDEIFRLSHARLKRMLSRALRETLPEFAGQRFAARRLDHSFWWHPNPQLREAIMQAALDRGKSRRL